jgi:hypothetical protein
MNVLASLLLVTAMLIPTPALVLKSGKRIDVDEAVRVEHGTVYFRSNRTLFSVPSSEVDLDATRAAGSVVTATPADETAKLKVSAEAREKMLRDLEKNHAGTPASKEQLSIPDAPKKATSTNPSGDEQSWRQSARAHEENVRQARENLQLLFVRAAEIREKISTFMSQGFKPGQFTYDTTQLARIEEQIPQAELEVRRAERAQQQFLDDARKQGVLPGWLR